MTVGGQVEHPNGGDTMLTITQVLDNGLIRLKDIILSAQTIEWNPHPSFQGVSLKHLVRAQDTEGRLSCHLVKIEPRCEIGSHVHETSLELHEVLVGDGHCWIDDNGMEYKPEVVALIPVNKVHRVKAGDDGLFIMAKFTPALL